MTATIIKFPKERKQTAPPIETLDKASKNYDQEIINKFLDLVCQNLWGNLREFGFQLGATDESIMDCCLVRESVRALLCRFYDKPHILQQMAERVFILNAETGETMFLNPSAILFQFANFAETSHYHNQDSNNDPRGLQPDHPQDPVGGPGNPQ